MLVLAIESSCDETAAAVVRDGRKILSSVVSSQIAIHAEYGGVVPEIASRKHLESISPVISQALREAGVALSLVFLYAASDEFHQRFVPTRTPLVSDVFIDTCGGAAGMFALWIFGRLRKRR